MYVTRCCMYVLVDDLCTLCVALFGVCIGYIKALLLV